MRIEDIFKVLNEAEVRYLLIGGLASVLYGVPRTTVDLDIVIDPAQENVKRTVETLKKLGFVCDTEIIEDILAQGGITFFNELEMDVVTDLPTKEEFHTLWERRNKVRYEGVDIDVISKEDHINILRKVAREQDIEDVKILSQD